MKTYLVGGAVRDKLLGLEASERDFVVVGARADELKVLGFRPVGRDFPVFLHPETHEEYALARTERKTAPGYQGFDFFASPEVTLEEDLLRRDLTINAMAMDDEGHLIDPWGGMRDLEARVLRHVSPAFAEDPVRILRISRFVARFRHLGFVIAPETLDLMRSMVDAGEIDALVPERVFREFERALQTEAPEAFLETLRECGALSRLFPEISALFGVPQDPKSHPEVDTGRHTLLVLAQSALLTQDPKVRFSALVHDLGKALTDASAWPSHPDHEALGLAPLEALGRRLKVPGDYLRLARKVVRWHGQIHKAQSLSSEQLFELLEQLDALRSPESLEAVLMACKADARGRPGHEKDPYPQAERMLEALKNAQSVRVSDLDVAGLQGVALGAALKAARIRAIAESGAG